MKRIITTVGTSIFENYLDQHDDIKTHYATLKDRPAAEWDGQTSRIELIRTTVSAWANGNDKASAEITSIRKILTERPGETNVHLLATDTILSRLAAEIIKTVLVTGDGIKCGNPKVLAGLQVGDYKKFSEEGFTSLFVAVKDIAAASENDECILNISGGYKAIIPQLTILGQLCDIPLCYIYESGEDLIWTNRVPVHFDWSVAEQYYPSLQALSQGREADEALFAEMREIQLVRVTAAGKKVITPFGRFFKDFIENELPIARTVLGHFIEFKVFESLVRKPYKDASDAVYAQVEHSIKVRHNGQHREIDLLLTDTSSNQVIVVECKSYYCFFGAASIAKVTAQTLSQLEILSGSGNLPKEYHILIYKTNDASGVDALKAIKKSLKDIASKIIETYPQVLVIFRYANVDMQIKDDRERRWFSNPYEKFMQNRLNIATINL